MDPECIVKSTRLTKLQRQFGHGLLIEKKVNSHQPLTAILVLIYFHRRRGIWFPAWQSHVWGSWFLLLQWCLTLQMNLHDYILPPIVCVIVRPAWIILPVSLAKSSIVFSLYVCNLLPGNTSGWGMSIMWFEGILEEVWQKFVHVCLKNLQT